MTADKRALAVGVFVWALAMPGVEGQRSATQGPAAGVIEGSIVDDTLEPLDDVPVILDQAGRTVASTHTDNTGAFRFNRIALGTYQLRATRAGYAGIQKAVSVRRGGATDENAVADAHRARIAGDRLPAAPGVDGAALGAGKAGPRLEDARQRREMVTQIAGRGEEGRLAVFVAAIAR